MFKSNRGGKFGGKSGGNGDKKYASRSFGRSFEKRERGPKELHSTTCAECGKPCEVPFKPSGAKPVFCRDCFNKEEQGEERNERFEKRDYGKRDFDDSRRDFRSSRQGSSNAATEQQLQMINDKLDRILRLLSSSEPM